MPESIKLILEIIGALITISAFILGVAGTIWAGKRKWDYDVLKATADNYKALYESEKEKNILLVDCQENTARLLNGQEELKSQHLELLSKM